METKEGAPSAAAVPAAGSVAAAHVLHLLQRGSREIRDLDLGRSVDRVALSALTPLSFATEYVQRNKPLIITGAIDTWPAMRLWGERYLESHPAGEAVVTVDVTPNGRGDAITTVGEPAPGCQPRRWFVTPHERRMSLRDFFALMRDTRAAEGVAGTAGGPPREVPYMQHQNSNLSEELGQLLGDVGPGLPWAERVFGGPPEATNLWIGDGRSATSFHKDHYENLYAVIRGTKIFTLLPPCDAYRMYLTRCPAASYMPAREMPSGAVFGDVSPTPGAAPPPRRRRSRSTKPAAAAAAAAVVDTSVSAVADTAEVPATRTGAALAEAGTDGAAAALERMAVEAGPSGGREKEEEEDGHDPGRLVAVLQEPGYEVLWSAVDTTTRDPGARRAQPLFFGPEAGPGEKEGGNRISGSHGGGGVSDGSSSSGASCDDDDDDDGGDDDPWVAAGGAPLIAEVGPGEVLYLPSMWYHQVEQREGRGEQRRDEEVSEQEYVIAVNYWYDMKYDGRYASFKLVEGLATALGLADRPPDRESGGE